MRLLFLFLTFFTATHTHGQVPLDRYTIDTLHLSPFTAKKTIVYKLNSVTFCIDYKDFMNMYTVLWKRYREGQKFIAKAKRNGEYFNPSGEPMWLVLDSIYSALKSQIKVRDTLYLNHTIFSKAGFGTWNNFFPELIESNRCAIMNEKGEQQFIVIRQKGSWYRDHLAAWGGRRYFLIGQANYFIDGTDWIS